MALSEQTSESLKKAEIHLRDALAFAARVEIPYVVRELGGIIAHLDNIQGTNPRDSLVNICLKNKYLSASL